MAESPEPVSVTEPGSLNPDSDLPSNGRVEIDTSTQFESVREAANRFGGFGFWRPTHNYKPPGAFQENVEGDIIRLKAQAAELQNDLIAKEGETLEVVKELEETKATVKELNLKLHQKNEKELLREEVDGCFKPAGAVLKDLSKAKMNLCKRTVDLAGIRESVEVLNKKLQEEKAALEKTRETYAKVFEGVKGETGENDALVMMNEVRRLSSEAQEFKKTGENAGLEIVKAMAAIEDTREKIKTAKIRLVAARKMKEAARAAEAVAIAEIKAGLSGALRTAVRERTEEKIIFVSEQHCQVQEQKRDNNNNTKNARLMDVNGLHLTYDDVAVGSSSSVPVLKPTMSIGQILSRKLLVAEDSDVMNVASERKKMSLGQMLAKSSSGDETWSKKSEGKENGKRSVTRKRFAKIAMLLKKESKNKKKIALKLR
ncbi:hypothetical protein Bca52824_003695 [Brassica carinata]|uniref:WEB family protein n=1 Tax=Brassica carinata TaxID=52824 RepID=A0A8X8BEZ7_BRACI|nr:hypothetical protein Bca52824_003695 [Brassica carinata]